MVTSISITFISFNLSSSFSTAVLIDFQSVCLLWHTSCPKLKGIFTQKSDRATLKSMHVMRRPNPTTNEIFMRIFFVKFFVQVITRYCSQLTGDPRISYENKYQINLAFYCRVFCFITANEFINWQGSCATIRHFTFLLLLTLQRWISLLKSFLRLRCMHAEYVQIFSNFLVHF